MKINICIPSYQRPKVETLDYLSNVKVYVAESEFEQYRQANPNADLISIPDEVQGNISRVRNYILDQNKGNITCIVDDDLRYIGMWEKNELYKLNEADVWAFLYKYTTLALDLGVKLWGIALNKDKQVYTEMIPFNLTKYIGAPFMVHIDPSLRFDENLPLKEDYDFTLQNLNKYRRVLRVNKFHYYVKQAEQKGGIASTRTMEEEKRQFDLLQKKWGSRIVKADRKKGGLAKMSNKTKKWDINPVINAPIAGV